MRRSGLNIVDAIKTGKPFRHDDMIGAYCLVKGEVFLENNVVHRRNIHDFRDRAWAADNLGSHFLFDDLTLGDLLREDWYVIENVNSDDYDPNFGYCPNV